MAKKKTAEIKIDKFRFPNIGVGEFEGCPAEIKRALPGQIVEAALAKKKGVFKGRMSNIIKHGVGEIEPLCPNTYKCGGCTFQPLTYGDEISIKWNMVKELFEGAGISEIEHAEFAQAPETYGYRNKMEFSFGDAYKNGPLNLGLRNPGSFYEVCDGGSCNICDSDFNEITAFTKVFFADRNEAFYHRVLHSGTLRHLVIRKGAYTGEILVNLVTAPEVQADLKEYATGLLNLKLKGKITGILHTVNNSVADVVLAEEMEILYGSDFFTDNILGLKFKIYPFSFFQTNTKGAERLYSTVDEFCGEEKVSTIFDLYCGTGTIAQILSKKADKVYGIELVESAVVAAKENAVVNGIDNCSFIAGDVLKEVGQLSSEPDIIILDPPREGIHPKAIGPIIAFGAKKIVYVSCKPSSLVRDLGLFMENGYGIEKIRIHDMFPRSYHVETVVLLSRVD